MADANARGKSTKGIDGNGRMTDVVNGKHSPRPISTNKTDLSVDGPQSDVLTPVGGITTGRGDPGPPAMQNMGVPQSLLDTILSSVEICSFLGTCPAPVEAQIPANPGPAPSPIPDLAPIPGSGPGPISELNPDSILNPNSKPNPKPKPKPKPNFDPNTGANTNSNSSTNPSKPIANPSASASQANAAGLTPDFLTVQAALKSLSSGQQLKRALRSISAEPYASMQSVALEALDTFRAYTLSFGSAKAIPFIIEDNNCIAEANQLNNQQLQQSQQSPVQDGQQSKGECESGMRTTLTPWSLLIGSGNTQANLNSSNDLASVDYNIFSSSYGLEFEINSQWNAGISFGYGQANLYNYEYSNARIDSSTYAGSIWGAYHPSNSWKITALLGYMNLQYQSERKIAFGGLNRTASANWSGNGLVTAIGAEYDWIISSDKQSRSAVRLKPSTFLTYALHSQGKITESGAGSLDLAIAGQSTDSLLYGFGFTLETPIITAKSSRFIPRLSLEYTYDFNGDSNNGRQLSSSFATLPALSSVTVVGQNRGSNALDLGLSLEYESSATLSVYGGIGGAFWSKGNELSYGGGVRLRW